jgi:dienelactone hydrolase
MTPKYKRVAAVSLVAASGLGLLLARRCGRREQAATSGASPDEFGIVAWCGEGLLPVAGGACYAAPPGAAPHSALPLVVYLHGLFEARIATQRGFAVLAPRGTQGACRTASEPTSLVCWPSNPRTADRAEAYVESWRPGLDAAAERHPFASRYVLGFSNGGYFAGLVAERALFEADAFVVAHSGPVEPVRADGKKPPMLLMSADEEPEVQDEMIRLDDELTREGWPHVHYVRDGGHALPDSDIEVALNFFVRTRTERWPLRPPLSTRVPRARSAVRDAEPAPSNEAEPANGTEDMTKEKAAAVPLEDGAAPLSAPAEATEPG